MPRTPVGLVNHPAITFNWQLPVANGRLIWRPVLSDFACEFGKGVRKQAGQIGFFGPIRRDFLEIAESQACRLATDKAKKNQSD